MTEEHRNHEADAELDWDRLRNIHGELAAFMLKLVDQSPDRLAILGVPHAVVRTDDEIADVEQIVIREYDRAKQDRPDLSCNLAGPTAKYPDAAILIAIHEHEWVGGHCTRGCGEQWDDDPERSQRN